MENTIIQLKNEFSLSNAALRKIAADFQQSMSDGLYLGNSCLKMLNAFLQPATGLEQGEFLALDLGGTNARSALIQLKGNGKFHFANRLSFPLKNSSTGIDYRSAKSSANALFDFLAELTVNSYPSSSNTPSRNPTHNPSGFSSFFQPLNQLADNINLGFTFSFPCEQLAVNHARLIAWTKEFRTPGVVCEDAGELLDAALKRISPEPKVKLSAIINDTVGTLLTVGYFDRNADIGSILATGHNSCYIETRKYSEPTLINIEAGNFSHLPLTTYDSDLDRDSETPGTQVFEKMVSAKYLPELWRLIIKDLRSRGILDLESGLFECPYALSGEDMSFFLTDTTSELSNISAWLAKSSEIKHSKLSERLLLREIASILSVRSAQLAAASYLGILSHIDPGFQRLHTITIDGSLFAAMPGYSLKLKETLAALCGDHSSLITLKLCKGGSLTGAALAAALASKG